MPVAAPRPCCHRGCDKYAAKGGYCEAHQKDRRTYDDRRESAAKRGYGAKWREARAAYLREHPFCVECHKGHLMVAAVVVDHVIPHKGDQDLFWDRSNWQSLCKHHHDQKTATQDMGAWAGGT